MERLPFEVIARVRVVLSKKAPLSFSLSFSLYYSDLAETSSVFPELKSKLKNHYRAHRLSFWLNLVPDLHKPGSDDVPRSHHLLDTEQVSFLSLSFSFLSYIFVWTIEFLIRGFAR